MSDLQVWTQFVQVSPDLAISRTSCLNFLGFGHVAVCHFAGNSLLSEDFVAYDLDNADDEWLRQYNGNQNRLAAEK